MKFLDVEQGSDQWLELRLDCLGASEAPAMMNQSKFMTRNQLLDLKKGWIKTKPSEFKERLMRDGHEYEAAARKLANIMLCENFEPVVCVAEIEGLAMLASLDGYSRSSGEIWENKSPNAVLAENVSNGLLEPHNFWQLEHQMLVMNKNYIHFWMSDGTHESTHKMIYASVKERRQELINGWHQFIRDLDAHELKAKKQVVVAGPVQDLPVLNVSVIDGQITSNIRDYINLISERANREINRHLESEQDFADKVALIKRLEEARQSLSERFNEVLRKFESFSNFSEMVDELDRILMVMQKDGEKKIKTEKERIKNEIKNKRLEAFGEAMKERDGEIEPYELEACANYHGGINPDFDMAMKNKRTIESLNNAADSELSRVMQIIDEYICTIKENIALINSKGEHAKLFDRIDIEPRLLKNKFEFNSYLDESIKRHKDLSASVSGDDSMPGWYDNMSTSDSSQERPDDDYFFGGDNASGGGLVSPSGHSMVIQATVIQEGPDDYGCEQAVDHSINAGAVAGKKIKVSCSLSMLRDVVPIMDLFLSNEFDISISSKIKRADFSKIGDINHNDLTSIFDAVSGCFVDICCFVDIENVDPVISSITGNFDCKTAMSESPCDDDAHIEITVL